MRQRVEAERSQWQQWQWFRVCWLGILVILGAIVAVLCHAPLLPATPMALPPSQYASTITAPFNQPEHYPITANPPAAQYRPVGEWVGRLILPTVEEYQQTLKTTQETDWAWFEVQTAPTSANPLIGQKVRLAWSQEPLVQAYVKTASRDVQFTPAAEQAFKSGVINPIRLNGRTQVGPLQSLAGAHPKNDVTVVLKGTVIVEGMNAQTSKPVTGTKRVEGAKDVKDVKPNLPATSPQASLLTLRINRDPFQETGRFYALVKFLELVPPPPPQKLPAQCPGRLPCASDFVRVQHYNPQTKRFDGPLEVLHIPQQPRDNQGISNMSTRDLPQSPAGTAGWYIYGALDRAGVFTVQAMQPRSLVQLPSQQTLLGWNQGLQYIAFDNWKDVVTRKGTLQTVLVSRTAKTLDIAQASWNIGDRAFLIHLYGGRGGTQPHSEKFIAGTYAGHFSFGMATVVRDPFTNEPIFDVNYLQVYGNGSDGTLSGAQTWANYMGNLRRGFMGTRPVSDVLVRMDALTKDYDFGGTRFSFFNELLGELSLIGARYRIGDGSGDSTITSATSCVQDSAQGLFLTLVRLRQKIEANPQVVEWLKAHPDDPNTLRFKELIELSQDLAHQLVPMGVVRWDWQENAAVLTGVASQNDFISIDDFQIKNLLTGLISWRTAMPRQAHDEFAMLFLKHRADLWFLRPNQIGGVDPGIAPLEPTLLLGAWKLPFTEIPIFAYLVIRTFGGVTIPTLLDWLKTLLLLVGFGAVAWAIASPRSVLSIPSAQGFLSWEPTSQPWYRQLLTLLRLLFVPALLEEFGFRVLLIPYPTEWLPTWSWWSWALLALGIYIAFHWLRCCWRKYPVADQPIFLILVALLGLTCTIAYRLTGSLWTITFIHWIAVSTWWLWLGGRARSLKQSKA